MINPELSGLVVRNIGDLEAAVVHARELDQRLFTAIGEGVKEQLADTDFHAHAIGDEEYVWFAPRSWLKNTTKDVEADYWFELLELPGPGDKFEETWIAQFANVGPHSAETGIWFCGSALKARRWKSLLARGDAIVARLMDAGFRQDPDQRIYFPLRLDLEELAKGFEDDDLTAALRPLRDAVATIMKCIDDFEALVALDRKQETQA